MRLGSPHVLNSFLDNITLALLALRKLDELGYVRSSLFIPYMLETDNIGCTFSKNISMCIKNMYFYLLLDEPLAFI